MRVKPPIRLEAIVDGKAENPYCPTCGQPTTYRSNPEWLMGHWGGRYGGMLARLIEGRRMKRGLSIKELLDAAYENMPTAMPTSPESGLRATLVGNKEKLAKLGWEIVGPHTTGNGFWLVPIEGY